jgi:hypothetical protein
MKIQTILTKRAGFDVPTELLVNILNRKPTAIGMVVQDTSGDKPSLAIHRESGTPAMGQLNEFQKNAHDLNVMMYFGELGPKFAKEDTQPITIDDGDGKPFLCLGIEGDYPKHALPNSGHTDEYNYATSILIPSLLDILNLTGGDFDKIVERINEDRFNDTNILSQIGHRGSVTIFPLVGEPIWLGKNDMGEAYDWGECSNRHGYGDAKQDPIEQPAPKKGGFSFGGFSKKTETSPPSSAAAAETKAEVKKTSVPEVSAKTVAVKVPDWVHKNDDKRVWYHMVAGCLPERWKNKVPVIPVIPIDKLPKDLSDLLHWQAEELKRKASAPVIANKEEIKPVKTETSAGAPKSGAEIAAMRAAENVPIIGAKDMEKILDFVAKNLDASGNEIPSVAQIQEIEKKLGDFTASVGSTPFEALNWPAAGLFALAALDRRAPVLLALEYRKLWRNTLKTEDLVGTAPKSTTTETKIGDNGKKVESIARDHVLAKEELKPEKKAGGFSFSNKKVA